jgi:WD40 repeat protein
LFSLYLLPTYVFQGFNGQIHIVHGFDPDVHTFLNNQTVRQIKTELALQKRGWEGLNEKSDLIGKLLHTFEDTPVFNPSISFAASGAGLVDIFVENDTLFSAGWDAKIVKWKVNSKIAPPERVCEFVGHNEGVNRVIRRGADSLLSGGSDGTVRLWDEGTCQCVTTFNVSQNWIWCLENIKTNPNVFYCGGVGRNTKKCDFFFVFLKKTFTGDLACFDTRDMKSVWRIKYPAEVSGLSLSLNMGIFATACFDGVVRLHDLRTQPVALLSRISASAERLTRCVLTNNRVIAGSFDGTVKIIDFE